MYKRLIHFTIIILTVGEILSSVAKAELIGHWRFDEGGGSTIYDSAGNGHRGALQGSPEWGSGVEGLGLALNLTDTYSGAKIDSFDPTGGTETFTLAFWHNWDGTGGIQHFFTKSNGWAANNMMFQVECKGDFGSSDVMNRLHLAYEGAPQAVMHEIPANEWAHTALVFDGATATGYLNGVDETGPQPTAIGGRVDCPVYIGSSQFAHDRNFRGWLDDMQLYSEVLSPDQIQRIMTGVILSRPAAVDPCPYDGEPNLLSDVLLSWTPGGNAAPSNGHIVYFGENFDDVNDANNGIAQDANSYDPGPLVYDTTYYWRVDEVNAPPASPGVVKGGIWSFTVEPLSYALAPLAATASSVFSQDMDPEKTIDGSGLDPNDAHSTEATDMWLSHPTDTERWIQFEFGVPQKLDRMWIWNSNQSSEYLMHLGVEDVNIVTSMDGLTWLSLTDVPEFSPASSSPDYTHNTVVDFNSVVAKYVKLNVETGYGLSEVRFFAIPVYAAEPQPVDGSTTEHVGVTLQWRSGRDANAHEVILSSDQTEVEDGSAVLTTIPDNTFSPVGLQYGMTYFWQINEIFDGEIPARYESAIWTFSTPEYFVVDDFEAYDDDCDRIFFTWEDGFGHSGSEACAVVPSHGNGTGSVVGNVQAPFAEISVVHGNHQAMPIIYDNTGAATNSETTRTFTSVQDWTLGSPQILALYFSGDPGNIGGQLYVKINHTKVSFNGSPAAISRSIWTPWTIELDSVVSTDLAGVSTLTIGIEGVGAQGILYVDDIRLYGQASEELIPLDPGIHNLVAHYAMEGNTQDSSGHGNHGAPIGNPFYAPGMTGMAVNLDGFDDRVDLGNLDIIGSGMTLTAWLNPEMYIYNDTRVISKATGTSAGDHWWMLSTEGTNHVLRFRLKTDGGGTTTLVATGSRGVLEGEWTHAAGTWDGSTMRIYQDLEEIASTAKVGTSVAVDSTISAVIGNQPFDAGDKHWKGLIDDVRVYNRGLSEAELLHIALE